VAAIDLNCDMGESYGIWRLGEDEAMLDVVTSANIACGFYAGDPSTMRRTCRLAAERKVAIGAQVGYPDIAGFGRRFVDMHPDELRDAVLYQLGALDAFAQVAGGEVAYVKPHGALYHACTTHPHQAEAVVAAVAEYDPSLAVLGPPGSALLGAATDADLEGIPEAIVYRAYRSDGRLVDRREPDAVLTDPVEVAERALRIASDGEVDAVDGTVVSVQARSLCVQGTSPSAVELARAVREALVGAGVSLASFT